MSMPIIWDELVFNVDLAFKYFPTSFKLRFMIAVNSKSYIKLVTVVVTQFPDVYST